MKKVSELSYKGQEFIVVDLGANVDPEFGNRFGTISTEFVENGKITKRMNGLEMCLNKSVAMAVEMRKSAIDYKELKASGMSDVEIFQKLLAQ